VDDLPRLIWEINEKSAKISGLFPWKYERGKVKPRIWLTSVTQIFADQRQSAKRSQRRSAAGRFGERQQVNGYCIQPERPKMNANRE
jgi:hypothetical protein